MKVYYDGQLQTDDETLSLREYMETDGIFPGQKIILQDSDGDSFQIWIGDATPYHEPSDNDGGFGWETKELLDCKITSIYLYS